MRDSAASSSSRVLLKISSAAARSSHSNEYLRLLEPVGSSMSRAFSCSVSCRIAKGKESIEDRAELITIAYESRIDISAAMLDSVAEVFPSMEMPDSSSFPSSDWG